VQQQAVEMKAMPETQNLALSIAQTVAEAVAEPLLVLDSRMRIRSANQAFYRAFRVSPDQIEGQLLYSISNCRWDILDLRDLLGHVLPDNKPFQDLEIEQDFPGVGNRVLVLSGRQLDGFPLILLAIDDLTDRRERDLRLAAIVESSDDAIVSKTLDGTIVSWNSGAERIYGYAAHEMIGRPSTTLAPESHEEEMSTIMERIRRGEKVRNFETKRRRKDGNIIDVSVTISPIRGHSGVITGVSMVDRDITDLKHTQEEHLAKQKLESVGTLAGGIAHNFNNLLGGVQAYSDLALAELASGSSPKQELERIRAGAVRGAEIELVDVSQIVEDMLELLKFSVSKHAKLETNLDKGMPAVRANPGQFAQIVMNLITNASEALGEEDGIIRVTTRLLKLGRDSAVAETLPESNYVQVEVSDTGPA
jgi:PAS domain S-box-containing protein